MYYLLDVVQARAKLKHQHQHQKKIIITKCFKMAALEFVSPGGFPVAGAPAPASETGALGDAANAKIQNGGIRAIH